MGKKKWFQSKTIIASICGVLFGVYDAAAAGLITGCGTTEGLCVHLPIIPAWVFSILAAFGVYGRVSANTVIK